MGNWKSLGGISLEGVLHTTEEVTVYVSAEGPGQLVIHFHKKQGVLSQLPRPDKKNAITSKAFVQIWQRAIGDHPLLHGASPQSYRIESDEKERYLCVEVHGLPDQPLPQKTTNGVLAQDSISLDAPELSDAEAMNTDEPPTMDASEVIATIAATVVEVSGPGSSKVAPEEVAETSEKVAETSEKVAEAEIVPLAASDEDTAQEEAESPAPLPGMELSNLPEIQKISGEERLQNLKEEIAAMPGAQVALTRLGAELSRPDSSRRLVENLYLYTATARFALEEGDKTRAWSALEKAFKFDPRDREVLSRYSLLLGESDDLDLALQVDRNLLLHHRRSLTQDELSNIFFNMGRSHRRNRDLERARGSFEQALEARPGNHAALDSLIKTVEDLGDIGEVIKVRQRLLDQTTDPDGRAVLLISIADDYRDRLGDPQKALETYESAVNEKPTVVALERIAEIATSLEDWNRAAKSWKQLGEIHTSVKDRAEALAKAASLYQHNLGAWEQAAACYKLSLQINPSDLSPFTELVSMLFGGERWNELAIAYRDMINQSSKSSDPSEKLLGDLWYRYGEVQRLHLKNNEEATRAYRQANSFVGDNPATLETLADLLLQRSDKDSLLEALGLYKTIMALSGGKRTDLLEKIGMTHLRMEEYDTAYCVLRALVFKGEANAKASAFVTNRTPTVPHEIDPSIDQEFITSYLYKNYEPTLASVFKLASLAVRKLLAHDLDHYGLHGRDRVDNKEGLVFNALYHKIGAKLGYGSMPQVYHKQDLPDLRNGSLHPSGFLVGSSILSGRSEKELAFVIAKNLLLFRDEAFLFHLRPLRDLQFIFYSMAKASNPGLNINMSKDMERVARSFKKLDPSQQERFQKDMASLLKQGELDLGALQTCYEDAANRLGFLFCDDLNTCRDMMALEGKPINPERSIEDRMKVLVNWSQSPEYFALRKALGITIG